MLINSLLDLNIEMINQISSVDVEMINHEGDADIGPRVALSVDISGDNVTLDLTLSDQV